jgi:hypothetical protein
MSYTESSPIKSITCVLNWIVLVFSILFI